MPLSASLTGLAFLMLFFAVTFLQSAVDKVVDWKGNLEFVTGHFKNSPLGGQVPLLLATLTVVEGVAGALCLAGACQLVFAQSTQLTYWALSICCVAFLMLLVGQRLAKDYAGAATIATYFGIAAVGFLLLNG